MKKIASLLAAATAMVGVCAVHAADTPPKEGHVYMVYNDAVAPPDQQAYETAVKAFNSCLSEHGYAYKWTALNHVTGNNYEYAYVSPPSTWADFDKMHDQAKECHDVWNSQANAHLKSESAAFIVELPGLSHAKPGMDPLGPLVSVSYFTLKMGHQHTVEFNNAVKKIAAAADKAHWPYYFTVYRLVGAGHGAPDYMVSSNHPNWAEYGAQADPSLWTMVKNVYGEKEQASIRKSLSDALSDASSHIDRVDPDLTYTPPGH